MLTRSLAPTSSIVSWQTHTHPSPSQLLCTAYVGRPVVLPPGKPSVRIGIDELRGNDRLRSLLSDLLLRKAEERSSAATVIRSSYFNTSLVVDLQRAGHVVEFERKKAALDQFIQAIRDPVGRFSVRVRREQIVGDGTSTEIVINE